MDPTIEEPTRTTGSSELARDTRETLSRAKHAAQHELGAHKSTLVQELSSIAHALYTAADSLSGEQREQSALYARHAARGVESLGDRLAGKSVEELLTDAQRTTRERPLWIGGAAMLAGFLGSRVLRSAERTRSAGFERGAPYDDREAKPPLTGGI